MLNPSEQEEMERIRGALGTFQEGHEERATRKIAQAFLLERNFFWNGALCKPYVKNLGAGIYAIFVTKNRA